MGFVGGAGKDNSAWELVKCCGKAERSSWGPPGAKGARGPPRFDL